MLRARDLTDALAKLAKVVEMSDTSSTTSVVFARARAIVSHETRRFSQITSDGSGARSTWDVDWSRYTFGTIYPCIPKGPAKVLPVRSRRLGCVVYPGAQKLQVE